MYRQAVLNRTQKRQTPQSREAYSRNNARQGKIINISETNNIEEV